MVQYPPLGVGGAGLHQRHLRAVRGRGDPRGEHGTQARAGQRLDIILDC